MNKETRQLLSRLSRLPGWSWSLRRGGHVRITGPRRVLLFIPSTPSEPRSLRNTRSLLRKHGADV